MNLRIRFDPATRRRGNGAFLIGGSPRRVLHLGALGSALVDAWARGEPIGPGDAERALAARLVTNGLAHPWPQDHTRAKASRATIQVVVPAHEDAAALSITLDHLGKSDAITVVDDASEPALVPVAGVAWLRRQHNGGPAAARNTGWRHHHISVEMTESGSDIVAFVDAGVTVSMDQLQRLALHFDDPTVMGVAPRVRSVAVVDSTLARHEERASPLDMGPDPRAVRPMSALTYVPSACLLVRREALAAVGGFDESLRYGEDVDLVWRLLASGSERHAEAADASTTSLAQEPSIRYEPSVVVGHPPRSSLMEFAMQRFRYGTAAGPLAERHGTHLAPWVTPRDALPALGGILGGRFLPGGSAVGMGIALISFVRSTRRMTRQLGRLPDPTVEATRFMAEGRWWSLRSFGETSVRTWWPLTLLVMCSPARAVARRAVAVGMVSRLIDVRDPRLLPLHLLDGVAYGAGAWVGAWRSRSARALLPRVV